MSKLYYVHNWATQRLTSMMTRLQTYCIACGQQFTLTFTSISSHLHAHRLWEKAYVPQKNCGKRGQWKYCHLSKAKRWENVMCSTCAWIQELNGIKSTETLWISSYSGARFTKFTTCCLQLATRDHFLLLVLTCLTYQKPQHTCNQCMTMQVDCRTRIFIKLLFIKHYFQMPGLFPAWRAISKTKCP